MEQNDLTCVSGALGAMAGMFERNGPLSTGSSYPGLLSIVVSGQNPKRTKVGAARSLETCLQVIHNLCYFQLGKANQKASPDSRGRELDSISW